MKEQEDIDYLFKSTFDDFTVAPPASVRESVNLAIAAKRKKKFVRWFFAGVFAFVILFVTAISMLDNAQRDSQLAQNNADNSNNNSISDHSTAKNTSATSHHGQNQNDGANAAVSSDTIKSVQGSEKILNSKKEKGSTASRWGSTNKKSKSGTRSVPSNSKSGKISHSKYLKDNRVKTGKPRVPKISAGKISSKGKNAKNPKSSKNNPGNTNGNSSGALAGNSGLQEGNKGLDEISDNGNKGGNGSTKIESSEETKAPEKKEDPISKVDSTLTPYADSSSLDEEPEKPEQKKKQDHPLLFSLRGGTTFGFNQLKTTDTVNTLKEKGSFFFQGEATYFLRPRIAITSGFNYEGRTENLSQEVTTMDSVVIGSHMEYIFDSLQILDSFLVDDYGIQAVTANRQNSYKLYAVSLPVLFTYSQDLSSKLKLDISGGAILSLQGSKIISETYNQGMTVVNKFGVKACVRTQLRYQFSAWGVSLNTNFGYDLIPVNSWNGVKRTRTFLDLGVGVHYLIGK